MNEKGAVSPADGCTAATIMTCLQGHQNIDSSIVAKLATMTMNQKKQFVENMDKWIASLKS